MKLHKPLSIVALGFCVWAALWCGGKTQGSPDDSGISSCTYYVSGAETLCDESDALAALDQCHHVLSEFYDGGLDAAIEPHRCAPTGSGCCAYVDDSGSWTNCYYGDAFTPAVVQKFCDESDGAYASP